ncbi:C40 family peptidase [Kitasatospora mediocidica]|uniref:C40 family peptidase n=1 Tax=Kitasatospora mediocidica TaxID=58352 RepID=UPI00068CA7F8|nr:C40 family peptidase [Kitasatospora mediocidica]
MSQHGPALRRCLTGLVGVGVASVLIATPAFAASATTSSSSVGGSISRDEVVQRAQSWVTEGVPYNQGANYSDSNGSYREDCSGYVSMAWHLGDSLVTQTLPSVSTQIDSSQLAPGDALDYTAEHVILFGNWVDQSAGTFNFYAENNPSELTNEYQGNLDASSLDGWPTSYYTPYRYNNVTGTGATASTTAPAPASTSTSTSTSTAASGSTSTSSASTSGSSSSSSSSWSSSKAGHGTTHTKSSAGHGRSWYDVHGWW